MHAIGQGRDDVIQEGRGRVTIRLTFESGNHKLGRAIDGNEQVMLALLGADLGNIDMQIRWIQVPIATQRFCVRTS